MKVTRLRGGGNSIWGEKENENGQNSFPALTVVDTVGGLVCSDRETTRGKGRKGGGGAVIGGRVTKKTRALWGGIQETCYCDEAGRDKRLQTKNETTRLEHNIGKGEGKGYPIKKDRGNGEILN